MPTPLDPKAFRRALGNFATGVTIITATTPAGEQTGVTANSFNSVSLDPALILWSIDKRSGSCAIFEQASHFAVNVLAADQIDLSNHFARPSEDKFAGINYNKGLGGAALFPECAASFQCESYQTLDGGDHWILIGKVVAFEDTGRAPLVYHQGSYAAVIPHSRLANQDRQASVASERLQLRLQDYYYYLMQQANRNYESEYFPLQQSSGLRTSEARVLMVLQEITQLSRKQLLAEVNLAEMDLDAAVAILQSKGWLEVDQDTYKITAQGQQLASELWTLAMQQQEKIFGQFSAAELSTFKKVLSKIANLD